MDGEIKYQKKWTYLILFYGNKKLKGGITLDKFIKIVADGYNEILINFNAISRLNISNDNEYYFLTLNDGTEYELDEVQYLKIRKWLDIYVVSTRNARELKNEQ